MGKGSAPRPLSVLAEEYARRWEATFGEHGSDAAKDGQLIEGDASGQPEGLTDGKAADIRDS